MGSTDELGATLAATEATTAPDGGERAATGLPAGYALGEVLGKGGMGEVLLARDAEIGRDVALKRVRAGLAGDAVARFVREAKIQARLDHPAIVPVYELGTDGDGRPFFTMKRLSGTTLGTRLEGGPALQPLLRAFVDVCLAIDFAHARGVVHRDLKPSNIMLGDYGEVYVLDWGIARIVGDEARAAGDITTLDGHTQAGAILGTPGFMAPEQVRGEEVGPAADVYALGCILFEILAGEPLHPRGSAAIAATVATPTASPAARKPDRRIAPELDASCTAALAAEPQARPTARALADRIQRFLDGDRDLERRRQLAAEQVEHARAELASGDPSRRRDAAQAAGRAIALDPENDAAIELVTKLVLDPPPELPPQLQEVIAAEEVELEKRRARAGAFAYLALFLWLPFIHWTEIHGWAELVLVFGGAMGMAALLAYNARTGRVPLGVIIAANFGFVVLFSRFASSLAVTPVLVCGIALAMASRVWVAERPWVVVVWAVGALAAPLLLEEVGVFERTWRMSSEGLVFWSALLGSHSSSDAWSILGGTIAIVAVVSLYASRLARDRSVAMRKSRIQAWHLEQLLPRGTRRLP